VFETEFLTTSAESQQIYKSALAKAVEVLSEHLPAKPYSGKDPKALAALLQFEMPQGGLTLLDVIASSKRVIAESISVTHPDTIAHLHCPPLIAALAAEVVTSALNQSMDSFDQAPAATVLEEKMVRWLCDEVRLGSTSGGVFTAGGTQSNYMGLLLARDASLEKHWNWPAKSDGLAPEARKLRIFCSDVAHFTVEKSAAQLGLGTNAVVRIPTDKAFRMDVPALKNALDQLRQSDLVPMAIVATAGTTDFGSIDPLSEIAPIAKSAGAWLHVDAAYGSALLFSARYRDRLKGIELADSVSMDFHKLFWQPISCAAFLLRDATQFRHLKLNADYLNPESHEQLGIPDLVSRSVSTTRRFDALKLWASFQALGREKLGAMIDTTIDLASVAADFIHKDSRLELIHEPELSAVVFRYSPANPNINADRLNADLRQHLFDSGQAVIGHTIVRGRQCLKLTCMNPTTSKKQIGELLGLVVETGRRLEKL